MGTWPKCELQLHLEDVVNISTCFYGVAWFRIVKVTGCCAKRAITYHLKLLLLFTSAVDEMTSDNEPAENSPLISY